MLRRKLSTARYTASGLGKEVAALSRYMAKAIPPFMHHKGAT
ncbi:hypothetical protein [Desulfolucanica intricata]|nr:hypothetical protein [Desulfolucanica intricata]